MLLFEDFKNFLYIDLTAIFVLPSFMIFCDQFKCSFSVGIQNMLFDNSWSLQNIGSRTHVLSKSWTLSIPVRECQISIEYS